MALRTAQEWNIWLSDLPVTKDILNKYSKEFVDAELTEEDLSELTHELLVEMNITKLGHRTKILKKARATEFTSTKVIKSAIKLPSIKMNSSPSKFRKFTIDWAIYKAEHHITGSKCNTLLYSACDESLQNNIINGLVNFINESEETLLDYIRCAATQQSNPTVYRLEFQKINQSDSQNIDQYVDFSLNVVKKIVVT